ncbi:MAG: DUF2147 domain-containing protein [Pseudomonadota bacterium]
MDHFGTMRLARLTLPVATWVGALLFLLPTFAAANGDPAFGLWLTENERAIIEIRPCQDRACGRIVWMDNQMTEAGAPKIDENNPIPALRRLTICGIPLVGNFKKVDPGSWQGGYVYNPRDGKSYEAEIQVQEDGSLRMRGFVLVSVFGKSQTWTRVADARGGCVSNRANRANR